MEVELTINLTAAEEEVLADMMRSWKRKYGFDLSVEACLMFVTRTALMAAIDIKKERDNYRQN